MKAAILTFVLSLILASPVAAKVVNIPLDCYAASDVLEYLVKNKFAPVGWGKTPGGDAVMHIWKTQDGNLFAAVVTTASGNSCIAFTGSEWTPIIWKINPTGSKT